MPEAARPSLDSDPLARLLAQAATTFRSARAATTMRAHGRDCREFRAWCERISLLPLPASAQAVILYSISSTMRLI